MIRLGTFIVIYFSVWGNVSSDVWEGNNYTGKLQDISYLICFVTELDCFISQH
jgi:hypothetical protein